MRKEGCLCLTCILRSAKSGQSYSKVHDKATQETCCSGTKAPDLEEDDKFYEDFNMNEVDLNIEKYEEIFGVALNDPEQLFGNDGIGSLLGVKDMSDADLNIEAHMQLSPLSLSALQCVTVNA
ncbi:Zinc finger protein CONSTANS-LIKE 9 [Camellia lanceoleosa]|uniref:Zinc finger protein CONSTANS-LIKE 9 n=1 Tax=Camellia lanceoleosa TaxID=1840588 RepID=A0ACC0FBI5_9ERIC|nr:Zinc finger protein CONSTANS-LIKE 9 [Camellia lanceoleosa]